MNFRTINTLAIAAGLTIANFTGIACDNASNAKSPASQPTAAESAKAAAEKAEWKKKLSPEAYHIMFEAGTETPFKNAYHDNHAKGTYVSAATGEPLFSSDAKFDSHTGWPSFTKPINDKAVELRQDADGSGRNEVVDASSGGHLGHLFNDGPPPTNNRYCINSAALKFVPAKE